MEMQRAFDPVIIPSAYCKPSLMITGWIDEEEKLKEGRNKASIVVL